MLAGAPFVPWPPSTYSNQVVAAKLIAMSSHHDVTFICGVGGDEDWRNLHAFAARARIRVRGVSAITPRSRTERLKTHVAWLTEAVAARLPRGVVIAGNRRLREALAREAASGRYDLVQLDYWFMGREWVHACPVPSVCYVHDLMFERLRGSARVGRLRFLRALQSANVRRVELETLAGFDALAAISPAEARRLSELLPSSLVASLPAGVDLQRLRPLGPPQEHQSAAFVAAFSSAPNEDAAWAFARSVWPRVRSRCPGARLYLVGRRPSSRLRGLHGRQGVQVIGEVRDVVPWYERCAAVVSPLRWGSGIKGKVLEAMALRRALVATAVSMEGIPAIPDRHYIGADSPDAFVDALATLFFNPVEADRIASAGRQLVEDHFDMSECLPRYLAFLAELSHA